MSCKGSISIYFVFAITLIVSVIMSVTEIARINCQKLYLQIATDAGVDSMASLYHRKLYEYYNLYGVEYRTLDMLETEYLSYIYPYFVDEDMYLRNWYVAKIDQDNIDLSFKTLLDEENFENEILKYEKYKLSGDVISFLGKDIGVENESDIDKLLDRAKEAFEEVEKSDLYGEIYERYFNFASYIKSLEDFAKNIFSYVDKVNNNIESMKSMATSGSESNLRTVSNKINEINTNISNLVTNLERFRDKMRDFREVVYESYGNYEADKVSGRYEFNDEICEFVESEFDHFLSYVNEESDMNKAVEKGFLDSEELSHLIIEHKRVIDEYVREYDLIDNLIRIERNKRSDERDNDYIRELNEEKRELLKEAADYLKDIKDTYKDIRMEQIDIPVSTTNHSDKESLLNKLVGFKDGILINLILSSEDLSKISNENVAYSSFDLLSKNKSISVNKILLGEYEIDKFNYYNKELNDEKTKSNSKKLEVERLISGKMSDIDSIKDVVNKILLIRIAMNVLHIYKSAEKRQAVRRFSITLFSGFSPLMAEAMFLLMITAWGTAQSISDLKRLMNNKRVNFMHNNESWTVSIENILSIATNNSFTEEEGDSDRGLSMNYKDYLRLLLMLTDQSDVDVRMVSIINKNLKDEQSSFDFEKLIFSFSVVNRFVCRHYFTNFVFVEANDTRLYNEYSITCDAYRCFYDN